MGKILISFYVLLISFFSFSLTYRNPRILSNDNLEIISSDNYNGLNIYFYPLAGDEKKLEQAKAEGDSYIIKINDVEILVDAGTDTGSNKAIMYQMKKLVSDDNVWDYIIVTHADTDHIGAFCTNGGTTGIFSLFLGETEDKMTLSTLIDFDITQDETVEYPYENLLFTSLTYLQYSSYRKKIVESGTKYYTASQCCWEQRGISKEKANGATNKFELAENIELEILYNYYNDHKFNPENSVTSADKNNLSVCFAINDYTNEEKVERLLFTGDLEEYDSANGYSSVLGETKLLEYNPQLKEGVIFYKAGHHGSRTSSSEHFIDNIRPQYVVITAIAGNNSYNHEPNSDESFPATNVLNRLFKYTDRIYIPAVAEYDDTGKTVKNYYGSIHVNYYNGKITVVTEENYVQGEPLPISQTEWFKKYRESTLNTFVFNGFVSETEGYFGSCTLVKYGHYDVLIDCGIFAFSGIRAIQSRNFMENVKKYCVDGVLECVIVSNNGSDSIHQMVSTKAIENVGNSKYERRTIEKGIFEEFKVELLIDYGYSSDPTQGANYSLFKEYNEIKSLALNYLSAKEAMTQKISLTEGLSIEILKNDYYETTYNADVCTIINFYDKKLLFTGNIQSKGEENIVKNNDLSNVVFYKVSDYGFEGANSELLLKTIKNDNLFIVVNSIPGENYYDKKIMTKEVCDRLNGCSKKTYLTMEKGSDGLYKEICGDIRFSIVIKNDKISYSLIGTKKDGQNNTIILAETDYYKNLKYQ